MRIGCSVGAAVVLLCAPVDVRAAGFEPDQPPSLCAGQAFADQIGTAARDRMQASRRPERLWGLDGPDVLTGSATRATCLFGGAKGDVLTLGTGGGVAFGETGSDALTGGPLDDVLRGGEGDDAIAGGAGADLLDGGTGRDALSAGEGDDLLDAADGRAEIVDCGAGQDLVAADRLDALIGCESPALAGPAARRAAPVSRRVARGDAVVARFRALRPGRYRVLLLDSTCTGAGAELAATDLRKGRRRITLRPPAEGWCAGTHRASVVLERSCPKRRRCVAPPPLEPVARLDFEAR